jgi:Domain of unknown function (DUF5919)
MLKGKVFRYLAAFILALIGIIIVLVVGPEPSTKFGQLWNSVGFGFIVSGVASVFRELFILKTETDETAETIANKTINLLDNHPIGTKGLKMAVKERRGYSGYYNWATTMGFQNLFFAGRSVLHRIDSDLKIRNLSSVEEALLKKLEAGSCVTILFLDPRSNLIERLAKEEGQTKRQLLSDIAFSIGATSRLFQLVKDKQWKPPTELDIRVYDEVPHFAYHQEDDKILVGFYFAESKGSKSAAFEVIDGDTRQFFENHFETICIRANDTSLLKITPHSLTASFNVNLYKELYKSLQNELGKRRTDGLIKGRIDTAEDD